MQRILVDWLQRDDLGVNHFLSRVPRDDGDAVPPAIPTVEGYGPAIFDETRHSWVAERKDPPATPALYVMMEGPVEVKGEPTPDGQIRATESPIAAIIRYISAESDLLKAIRDGEYTLRAVMRSVRELMRNVYVTSRTRNGVAIVASVDPALYFPIVEAVGEYRVSGAVGLNLVARDNDPAFT